MAKNDNNSGSGMPVQTNSSSPAGVEVTKGASTADVPSIIIAPAISTSLEHALLSDAKASPSWLPKESTLPQTESVFVNRLPPLDEMDRFVTQSAENFLVLLPDMTENIRRLITHYPEVYLEVWEKLKSILQEGEARDQLHGRNVDLPKVPECAARPEVKVNVHGDAMVDNYTWLKDRENPEVLKYIDDENQYAVARLRHTEPLQKLLYNEFVSRLNANEESAKVTLQDGWTYYSKSSVGLEYRLHCRSKLGVSEEQVYLDENEIARGPEYHDSTYFRVGFLRHSPDCQTVAYGVDPMGNERFTTFFLNVETNQLLPDKLIKIYENLEFSSCGRFVYYLTLVPETERAFRIYRHELGTILEDDQLLYEEKDEMFCLTMTKSGDGKFIMINSAAQVTSETLFIHAEATKEDVELGVIMPRKEGVTYSAESFNGGYFFVLTNEDSKNNWLFRVPAPQFCMTGSTTTTTTTTTGVTTGRKDYEKKPRQTCAELLNQRETVISHRDFVLIEDFHVRGRHLVVFERSNCHQNVRVIELISAPSPLPPTAATTTLMDHSVSTSSLTIGLQPGPFDNYHYISFADNVYSLLPASVDDEVSNLSKMALYNTNVLRFTYSSLIQPRQVIDYNMDTRESVVVHTEEIAGNPEYNISNYEQLRLFATGTDGTAIPMSIVFRKDLIEINRTTGEANPCLLYTYGAYGSCVDPVFSTQRLSLLDRGFIYAIAHVRGGSDMGMGWYDEGKLGKKMNTFMDFISCAEYLIKERYTSPEKLAIYGRSAGGLMIGAVINMRPDLFKTALTEVPFVDAVNTMLDSSIPWTAFEWEEWGNPEEPEIYKVMKQYCPYTNVRPQRYPNMLVLGGMNDPRVAYFEPLKWVAKLRSCWPKQATINPSTTTGGVEEGDDERMLLLRIEEVGHGGNSGQYAYLEDLAFEYAFLISTLQAPVFRIETAVVPALSLSFQAVGGDASMTPMTPRSLRRRKMAFANIVSADSGDNHNQDDQNNDNDEDEVDVDGNVAKKSSSRGSLRTRELSFSTLATTNTTGKGKSNSTAVGTAAVQPESEVHDKAKENDQGGTSQRVVGKPELVLLANRRRSTTLLEFSEKSNKTNGKIPAPGQPRGHSKLTDWIANFF